MANVLTLTTTSSVTLYHLNAYTSIILKAVQCTYQHIACTVVDCIHVGQLSRTW